MVVGDYCRDHWIETQELTRDEGRVVMTLPGRKEVTDGMAGLVARTVAWLGGEPILIHRQWHCHRERFLQPARPGHNPLVLRVDTNPEEGMTVSERGEIVRKVALYLRGGTIDAVVLSDYGYGTLHPSFLMILLNECRERKVPVIVDPARSVSWDHYDGATIIKASVNEFEADQKLWCRGRASEFDPLVFVTNGPAGIAWVKKSQIEVEEAIPIVDADGFGCGDVVTAALALAVAADVRNVARLMAIARCAGACAATQKQSPQVTQEGLEATARKFYSTASASPQATAAS